MSDDNRNGVIPPSVQRDLGIQAQARADERNRAIAILKLAKPTTPAQVMEAIATGMTVADFKHSLGPNGGTKNAPSPSSWGEITSRLNAEQQTKREARSGSAV